MAYGLGASYIVQYELQQLGLQWSNVAMTAVRWREGRSGWVGGRGRKRDREGEMVEKRERKKEEERKGETETVRKRDPASVGRREGERERG